MKNKLYHTLLKDLRSIGIESNFKLTLKDYSHTMYGRYNPNVSEIVLYIFEDVNCTKCYPYDKLIDTLIHEVVHHIQWKDPNYIRLKGVMHDVSFHTLYNKYSKKYKTKAILREVFNEDFEDNVGFNECVFETFSYSF